MNSLKCINLLEQNNVDAVLLLNEANMHYICGFSPSEGMILITKEGKSYHLVDSRYTETAQNYAKDSKLTVIEINKSFIEELSALIKKNNIKSLYYENETISLKSYESLKEHNSNVELLPLDNKIMELRNVKEEYEIDLMKQANEIAEKSYLELLNHIEVGKTERELVAYFDYLMAKNGSYGVSFDTILLTGAHSSMPHGTPSERKVEKGDFVLFDFGATYKGYHSDMTRMVVIDHASDEMINDYNLVLSAQLAGINALKAGTKCKDVYKAAYDVLDEQNKAQYFRHGLGHGIGIEIHEGYNASSLSKDTYTVGNVTSIEPGIYLPNKYGIRIEDMLYISPNGTIDLSTVPKEINILK